MTTMKIRVTLTVDVDPDEWVKATRIPERMLWRLELRDYILNSVKTLPLIEESGATVWQTWTHRR